MNIQLIERLADGQFHSGEDLGQSLGLSRAAIWKQVEALTAAGLAVERVRGKGYRIAGGLELLNAERIRALGGERLQALPVQVALVTASTNEDALREVSAGAATPFACLAERQLAGRGRRGRAWQSPLGSNIYLSLCLSFELGAAALEGLSLVVGLGVLDVLRRAGLDERAGLKWPNDLWVDGRKLAGILIELAGDMDGRCQVVIGVGINLVPLPDSMADEVVQPWTDLASELGQRPQRNALVADLLATLLASCERFAREGFAPFRDHWQAVDVLMGRAVLVSSGPNTVAGRCCGVDPRGALLVDVDGEVQALHGGEVTLRPSEPGEAL